MEEETMVLCPSVLGLRRVGEVIVTEKKRRPDMPVLNNRGMPSRIRKKNPLFFSNEMFQIEERRNNKLKHQHQHQPPNVIELIKKKQTTTNMNKNMNMNMNMKKKMLEANKVVTRSSNNIIKKKGRPPLQHPRQPPPNKVVTVGRKAKIEKPHDDDGNNNNNNDNNKSKCDNNKKPVVIFKLPDDRKKMKKKNAHDDNKKKLHYNDDNKKKKAIIKEKQVNKGTMAASASSSSSSSSSSSPSSSSSSSPSSLSLSDKRKTKKVHKQQQQQQQHQQQPQQQRRRRGRPKLPRLHQQQQHKSDEEDKKEEDKREAKGQQKQQQLEMVKRMKEKRGGGEAKGQQKQQQLEMVKRMKEKRGGDGVVVDNRWKKDSAQAMGLRLRNLLKLPKALNWVCCEFFNNIVDKAIFEQYDNDFVICMKESFPAIKQFKLTRTQWSMIRRMLGKPRRCSPLFFKEEIAELNRKRTVLRNLQRGKYEELRNIKDIPNQLPVLPVETSRVTVRLRKQQRGLFDGCVCDVDAANNSFRLVFDNPFLQKEYALDLDIMFSKKLKYVTKCDILKSLYAASQVPENKFARKLIREYRAKIEMKNYRKKAAEMAKMLKERENANEIMKATVAQMNAHQKESSKATAVVVVVAADAVSSSSSSNCNSNSSLSQMTSAKPLSQMMSATSGNASTSSKQKVEEEQQQQQQLRKEIIPDFLANGKHPAELILAVAQLKKLLHYKDMQIQCIRDMNTEIERTFLYEKEVSDEFQTKYASGIITLEVINADLLNTINDVNVQLEALAPKEAVSSVLNPIYMQDDTLNKATELVEKNNIVVFPDNVVKTLIQEKPVLNTIKDLTSLLIQVKDLAANEHNDYEVDVIRKTMLQIKTNLTAENKKIFENSVEVHMQHIQSSLMGPSSEASSSHNSNKDEKEEDPFYLYQLL